MLDDDGFHHLFGYFFDRLLYLLVDIFVALPYGKGRIEIEVGLLVPTLEIFYHIPQLLESVSIVEHTGVFIAAFGVLAQHLVGVSVFFYEIDPFGPTAESLQPHAAAPSKDLYKVFVYDIKLQDIEQRLFEDTFGASCHLLAGEFQLFTFVFACYDTGRELFFHTSPFVKSYHKDFLDKIIKI